MLLPFPGPNVPKEDVFAGLLTDSGVAALMGSQVFTAQATVLSLKALMQSLRNNTEDTNEPVSPPNRP